MVTIQSDQQLAGDNRIRYIPPETLSPNNYQKLTTFTPPNADGRIVLWSGQAGGINIMPRDSIADGGGGGVPQDLLIRWYNAGVTVVTMGATGFASGHLGGGLFREYTSDHYLVTGSHSGDGWEWFWAARDAEWAIQKVKQLIADGDLPGQPSVTYDPADIIVAGSSRAAIAFMQAALVDRAKVSGSSQVQQSTRVKAIVAFRAQCTYEAFVQNNMLYSRYFPAAGDADSGVQAANLSDVSQAWQRGASPVTQVNAAGAAVDLTPIYLSYDNAVEEEDFSVDGGGFPSLFSTIVNTHALWHGVMYAHRIKAYDAAFYDTFCRLAVKSGIELAAPNDVHHFVFPSGQTFNGQAVEDDCYQWALDRWAGVGTIDPPTDVAYTPDSATVEIGQAIPNLVPSFSGGMPSSYAVQSGSLPSGISLNPVSGVISGTPTADDGSNPVVVRATNSAGFDDAGDVTLTVNAVTAPSNLAYTPPSAIVPRGTAVSLVPSWDGGAVTTWAVSAGTLPAGLTLNASTGVISGITTTEYASAQVTIQATNAGGNDTEDITFEVLSTQDIPFLTGMNTSRVNDFTSQYPWKNFMWRSFPWRFRLPNGTIIPGHPDNGGQFVPLNAQGYPDFSDPIFADGRTAIAEVVSLQGPRYPAGIYTITYQGGQQGDVIFHKSGSQDVVGDPTLDEPGRLKQEVVPGSGANNLTVRVKGTVTGIQIWSPGHDPAEDPEPTKILHPDFVAKWQECTDPGTPFRPLVMWAVEFCGAGLYSPGMQLTRKGWDPVPGGGWPHKSPDDPSMGVNPAQQQSGASTDVIVKMANELDRDLWVNVAHRYDDLSVRRQAEYIRDNLSPTLRCVLEFENEIWNPGFPVWNYHDEIIAPQTGESLEQWAGRRISEVFAIYADVFAGQHQRLVRYVGGWRGQPSFTEDVLSYVTEQVDAAGVAPYFQPDSAQISAWAGSPPTVTDFIQHIIDRKDLVRVKLEQNRDIVDAKAAAQGSPIRHVYYEAGLALQFFHSTLQAVGKQALLHPFMQDCYLTYMALFAELGIETVVWYRFCDEVPGSLGGGAWGHTRSLTVVTGSGTDPRWDAITKHGLAQDEVTFSGYNPAGPYVWELDAEEVYLEPVTVGNIDTFSVESGTLPTGVTLDTGTGLITGTPSTTASGEMVTIRGANSVSGDFQEVVLDITVAAPTPPVGLSYSNSDQTVNIGQPIATMNPSLISGDVGVTYSIAPTSPQLPTGVTLNPSTGVISGTPTQTYADQDICVEARNVAGFDEALVQLQVVNGPPTNPSIVPNPAVAEVDEAVSIQCSAVGQGLTWTDEDALPAGLSLNASSGLITGSVSSPVAQANYTMRATNAQGFVEIELDLEIVAAAGEAPRNLTITPPGGQFPVGEPLVLQVSAQGTAPIAFTAPGGLPPGLSISELTPTTAEITGSPSTVVDADYTVRATNAFGQVDQVIHIVTAEAPPTLSYPNEGGGQLTWPINVFVSLPADATGNNLSFDIVEGTLPAGIDIRPLSGRLRGTPTEATFEQRVVVRASNAGGFAEFELFITVEQEVTPPQPPSAFSYAPAELDLTAGDAPIQLVPTISGTAPFTFEVHQGPIGENPTRLPRMLRLNASTGIITGRPTEIRDGATYRIRARNPHGFADAFIDIEVVRGREGGGPTFIRVGRPGRPRTNEPPDIIPLISDPDDLLDLLLGEDDAEEAPRR